MNEIKVSVNSKCYTLSGLSKHQIDQYMKLIEIFNLLIDVRDQIERENEEFVCSCCLNTVENLNTVINALAEIINPTNRPTVSDFLEYCTKHNLIPGREESLRQFYNSEVKNEERIHTI